MGHGTGFEPVKIPHSKCGDFPSLSTRDYGWVRTARTLIYWLRTSYSTFKLSPIIWCQQNDLHIRSPKTADLQSAGFVCFPILA